MIPSALSAVARIVRTTLSEEDRLLDEIDAHRLAPGDLDASAITQLVGGGPPDPRARAKALLVERQPEGRKQVLERYADAVKMLS
jgi:hypothetical protein